MMKILIVDDEPLARERLRDLLGQIDDVEICGEASNGREALQACETKEPDVVLMDIRMPVMDGLEAARHLARCEQPPAVIFVTAYDQHALSAFEAHAAGYLVKPIRQSRLQEALHHLPRLNRAQLVSVQEQASSHAARSHLCVRQGGRLQLVPVDEVLYFLAEQKYVTACLRDGEVLLEDSLKALEQEFEDSFVRIHRNALIALSQLAGIDKHKSGQVVVLLKDSDRQLEVSRRHVPDLRKLLRQG